MLRSVRSLLCATSLAAALALSPSLASAQSVIPHLEAQIRSRAAEVEDRLIAWRRDIHEHPELGEQETRTAGLVAAAEAASRGARVVVHEKGDRPGGSMLLSSGVVWRYRSFEDFRRECPDGTPELQRLVHERLDADLAWLGRLGARVVARSTVNPRTVGLRFDTLSLTEALAANGGELRLGAPLREIPDGAPVVLATGGFQASRELVRLDLPRNPGNYVRIEPRVDNQGRVWLLVENRAPVSIRGVTIGAGILDETGRTVLQGPVRVSTGSTVIASGQVAQVATPLGPVTDAATLNRVRYQVESASLAE